jgi:hypothetical protein
MSIAETLPLPLTLTFPDEMDVMRSRPEKDTRSLLLYRPLGEAST